MTKFIPCQNGDYINTSMISKIHVDEDFDVVAVILGERRIMQSEFNSEEEAQEWLDKFMLKHGLCLATEDNN